MILQSNSQKFQILFSDVFFGGVAIRRNSNIVYWGLHRGPFLQAPAVSELPGKDVEPAAQKGPKRLGRKAPAVFGAKGCRLPGLPYKQISILNPNPKFEPLNPETLNPKPQNPKP